MEFEIMCRRESSAQHDLAHERTVTAPQAQQRQPALEEAICISTRLFFRIVHHLPMVLISLMDIFFNCR